MGVIIGFLFGLAAGGFVALQIYYYMEDELEQHKQTTPTPVKPFSIMFDDYQLKRSAYYDQPSEN